MNFGREWPSETLRAAVAPEFKSERKTGAIFDAAGCGAVAGLAFDGETLAAAAFSDTPVFGAGGQTAACQGIIRTAQHLASAS